MLATLQVRTRATRTPIELTGERELIVGRAAECDVVLDDTSVSRRHCSLALRGTAVVVTDLGSVHGLRLGEQRVERCELQVGDAVRIGAAELRFDLLERLDLPAAAPADPEPIDPAEVAAKLDPLVGSTLGNYRVVARLGQGGFATVYRAVQNQLEREVALKVLRASEDGDPTGHLEAFLREARAAAALSDPRLVQIYDFGDDAGRHFLSMELVRGGSLARHVRQHGPMAWNQLLPIVRDVAGALQVAHAAGMVHRDVKPGNVLLTPDGRGKLADLGLVGAIGIAADRVGTAAFMAPEQLRKEPLDARTDLYALGCTIYAALTGRSPFAGSDQKAIVKAQLRDAPPPLPPGTLSPEADRLLRERLLAKSPDQRPASAEQLLAELDRLESPKPRAAAPRRHRVRGKRGGHGGSLLLIAIGLAAVAFAVYYRLSSPAD